LLCVFDATDEGVGVNDIRFVEVTIIVRPMDPGWNGEVMVKIPLSGNLLSYKKNPRVMTKVAWMLLEGFAKCYMKVQGVDVKEMS
jgi:hypothetical protein